MVLTPVAEADLAEITEYIGVEHGNVDAANSLLRSLRDAVVLLERFPELGRPRANYSVAGLRALTVEGFTVFYRIRNQQIEVGRIVHPRRERHRLIEEWQQGEHDRDASAYD